MKKTALIGLLVSHLAGFANPAQAQDKVGIEEKLGEQVPLDLTLRDEQGGPVSLRNLVTKPTLVAFVYYKCPGICTPLLTDLARLLKESDLVAGRDFTLLAVSIDPTETPALASEKKSVYSSLVQKPLAPEGWRFLTADAETVRRFTDSTGFRYMPDGKDFRHAAAVIALSPDGKICRYLYGKNLLPFDLKMAVAEASEGKTGPSVARVLLFCFSYDPAGRRYTLNIMRIAGAVIVVLVGGFFLYLVLRRKPAAEGQ